MWEVRGQWNKPNPEAVNDPQLEWSSVNCDTREEAEDWWKCRTFRKRSHGGDRTSVSTMFDPNGNVVKVMFRP